MLGLIVLTVGGLLLAAYVWLVFVIYRFVRRRTGSDVWGALSVLGILVLTVGDTVFNRWYVTNVLCQREDVGVKVFETVRLPKEHWDESNNRPALPIDMRVGKPFLDRYITVEKNDHGGFRPFTYHSRIQFLVIDTKREKVLTRFVNYSPRGGMWWTFPLALVGNEPWLAWFFSRGHPTSCFTHQRDGFDSARMAAFERLQ